MFGLVFKYPDSWQDWLYLALLIVCLPQVFWWCVVILFKKGEQDGNNPHDPADSARDLVSPGHHRRP